MRGAAVVFGGFAAILVVIAVLWIVSDLLQPRRSRPVRTGPSWGAWLRDLVHRRERERERLLQEEWNRKARWEKFCRKELASGEWVIGVHRSPLAGDPFDERVMFTLPPDVDILERLDREGDAVGYAHDFNARREGMS